MIAGDVIIYLYSNNSVDVIISEIPMQVGESYKAFLISTRSVAEPHLRWRRTRTVLYEVQRVLVA
jgi:hypothetical protein